MSEVVNRLILEACLVQKSELRYTLANLPVVEALFNYSGAQEENGAARQADFDLTIVSLGEIADILSQAEVGKFYRLQGFINRKSLKSIKLRLHLTHISPIH